MIRKKINEKTSIYIQESYEGETIETKLKRILTNGEPITDGAPIVYTERKDGVKPEYDIRTDKWDLAIDAMDIAHKQEITRRKTAIEEREKAKMTPIKGGQTEAGAGAETGT